ncbi:MAG: Veg family protein [Firmicutes bacterium]|nr:Veg family protein [Bacillota bacterium]
MATKKTTLTVGEVKSTIDNLLGKEIKMRVCRGRKQVKKYTGVIENTFPSVFVVRIHDTIETGTKQSAPVTPTLVYSYSDVICQEVLVDPMVTA